MLARYLAIVIPAAAVIAYSAIAEESRPFTITYDAPPKGLEHLFGSAWWIYLDGRIDNEAGQRLETFIDQNNVPIRSLIILNSPGGSVYGGMELGRIIRKHSFETDVGIRDTKNYKRSYTSGGCYSACTYAYLGGRFRYMKQGSHFGVHRFYSSKPSEVDMDLAQITSANLMSFIREMEVDQDFFKLTAAAGADKIFEPSREMLEKLNVINDGVTLPRWTLESNDGGIYLKAERDTTFGANKVLIHCLAPGSNTIALQILIDPQGHEEELLNMPRHLLVVDGDMNVIKPAIKKIENDWFRAAYILNSSQVVALMKAKLIGVVISPGVDSPIVLGLQHLQMNEGKQKLKGIVNACMQ